MEPRRCHHYLLAAVLILTALLAAPQAQAHGGSHAQIRQHHVALPAHSGNVSLASVVSLPSNPQTGQCGAMMCCGSACAPPGCVVAAEVVLPPPPSAANTVLPKDTPPSGGRDAEGVRRPPRA